MRKHLSTILLALVFVIGLSLLIYPTFSDYWNSFHQSRAIASYTDAVANMDDDTYERMWAEAQAYNRTLMQKPLHFDLTPEEKKEYEAKLDVSGTGMMGYIEIPSIRCRLPIYHGTNDAVLQTSIGHIEGSSLPVGGTGTHCVLSGHRGLPSAKLFTDLDQLVEGDTFMLHVLDETLTYEVDQILIVLPEEISALTIEEDKDLCTLVTCTPYGINTHRMLVRGHRIANEELGVRVPADAMQIDPMLIAPIVAAVILITLLIWLLVKYRKKKES